MNETGKARRMSRERAKDVHYTRGVKSLSLSHIPLNSSCACGASHVRAGGHFFFSVGGGEEIGVLNTISVTFMVAVHFF